MAQAMFGAGCFWGVEYNFSKVKGVNEVVSGYSGGKTNNPTYEQVCSSTTEHAEVVLIDYDSGEILFELEPDMSIYPASMTKIMTSIVAFDLLKKNQLRLDDEFVSSENACRMS